MSHAYDMILSRCRSTCTTNLYVLCICICWFAICTSTVALGVFEYYTVQSILHLYFCSCGQNAHYACTLRHLELTTGVVHRDRTGGSLNKRWIQPCPFLLDFGWRLKRSRSSFTDDCRTRDAREGIFRKNSTVSSSSACLLVRVFTSPSSIKEPHESMLLKETLNTDGMSSKGMDLERAGRPSGFISRSDLSQFRRCCILRPCFV